MVLLVLGVMYDYRTPIENKVDPRCYLDDYTKVWVYFTDKGVSVEEFEDALQAVEKQMTPAARRRRALRRGITDYGDLPLYDEYVSEIETRGAFLMKRSKWLNAASFIVARDEMDQIAQLDFVYKITRVAPFRAPRETEATVEDTAIYGLTYRQSQMFGIDRVHDIGIFGSNVIVGILDTGLRRRPIALRDIFLLAEHDFLGGDQLFLDNIPVTAEYGTYSDIAFHKTTNRLNIFMSCDTVTNSENVRDIFHTYSTDGGDTWASLINITHNLNNWARDLDVCGRDTMFVFYREEYFSNPLLKYTVVSDTMLVSPTQLALPGRREPSGVYIGDTVYVVYYGKDSDQHKLFLKQGDISGFGSEILIDSSASSIKAPNTMGGDSKIGIFYHIFPEDTLYFIKSDLPIISFTKTFITRGKDAEAITSGDTLFVIWKDRTNDPLFRIAFAKSEDFGETFANPLYLSENLNSIGKISLAKSNETITVAWETAGRIYHRTSNNNGMGFGNLDSLNWPFACLPTLAEIDGNIRIFYGVRGDSVTDGYSPLDPDYWHPRHGTEMLGIIGGDFDGRYRGVAPGAQFLVAKTENPDTLPDYEFPVEEDTYIAGLEWCESMGVDIISSSLGYSEWYSWPHDYDGRTSPASIAAYEATKRGVVVVTAAGNVVGSRLDMPGDAVDVITVGGIDTLYNRWQYSGHGPTYDGRMKPEIVCLADAPVVVDPDSTDSYLYSTGTSGATAMTAGICALLLEAHPNWNVDSVRNALFSTASHASTPNDSMGYGWPDVFAAIHYSPILADTTRGSAWLSPFPNPFILGEHNYIYAPFKLDRKSSVEIRVYSMSGKLIIEQEREGLLPPGSYTDTNPNAANAAFVWDGLDEDGNEVASGIYYCVLNTRGAGNDVVKIAVVR